ncbi:MAG: zinc metallopeptidase [Gaiellales bacterium]
MSGYFIIFLLPMIAGFLAQSWVRKAVARAQDVPVGMTGAEAAHRILARHGAMQVRVETSPGGPLSDHYDPREKVIRLSDEIANRNSAAAVAIAAHECGHALQHHNAHAMFRARTALAPTAAVASQLWVLPLMLGLFAGYAGLIWVAVALFSAVLLFHLVTLPVEIDASRRAMRILREDGMVDAQDAPAARRVLTAAASTYIVAALTSIAMLIYILGARR